MNTNHTHPRSAEESPELKSHSAKGLVGWALAALGLVATLVLLAASVDRAGAKEPVTVAIRPDITAGLAAAALGADDKPEPGTGTFQGTVTFKGTPPKRKVVLTKGDPTVEKPEDRALCAAEEYLSDELLINEKADNGVANVVVYLRKAPEGYKAPPPPKTPVVFDQKGCRFIPHVFVIRCDQKLLIKSDDPVGHNTNITTVRNTGFNQVIKANDREGLAHVFKKPEGLPMPIKCDLHKWMKAHYLPLDHPFAAVTDEKGNFEIKGLPPGKHTFTVWHEGPGYLAQKLVVEIKADKVKEEKLSYTAAQFQGR